jgi:hypothetical protein
MDAILLLIGLGAAWLAIATLLALGLGRAVAVARVREEHLPPRTDAARASLARRTTTLVLGRPAAARSR